MEYNIIQYRTV